MSDDIVLPLRVMRLAPLVAANLLHPGSVAGIGDALTIAQNHANGCDPCSHSVQPTPGPNRPPPWWVIVDEPDGIVMLDAPVRYLVDIAGLAALGTEPLELYVLLTDQDIDHDDAIRLIPVLLWKEPDQ